MIRKPVVIAGARPNFPKVAPVMHAFERCGIDAQLVHTGQHYDAAMSASFFDALDIPEPVANLEIGSGSHGEQTAGVMVAFEQWLDGHPEVDAVLVVGDVNSTVACGLVAAKAGIPLGHIEAGLRSFDRTMPEEINRVVVDSLATWLFTPSEDGDVNLSAEGVEPSRVFRVGNVMVDSLFRALPAAKQRPVLDEFGLTEGGFGLVTLHRPALVDDPMRLADMLATLCDVAERIPLAFPVHPRTRNMLEQLGVSLDGVDITLLDPQQYLDFLRLEASAAVVITDSGGVQEETTALGVPCLTVRENTERPITITLGTNVLVGFDHDRIVAAVDDALGQARTPAAVPLWDGRAAERIVQVLSGPLPSARFVPPSLDR